LSEWRIPLSDLDYGIEEESALLRVLRSKWLSMGPEVQAFEAEFAQALGIKHALAIANGTAALHLSYLALRLHPGDEVIQPAINFVAAANMAVAVGAIPVFADIVDLNEPTIDPVDIERKISPRTKAVVVMHYGGYCSRMAEIPRVCQEHKLSLIEDACHTVGACDLVSEGNFPKAETAGHWGDLACFSFFGNKNLAIGEGGMVVTDRDDLAQHVRLLRSHGMTTLTWDRHEGHASSYDVVTHGLNYRLDELRAALGRAQLGKLKRNHGLREKLVLAYRENLSSLEGWTIPFSIESGHSAYHLMVVVAPDQASRDRARRDLAQARIQTSMHYPCVADFQAFRNSNVVGLEHSRSFAKRALTLPLFPTMTISQVEEICGIIRSAS
jgi:dTDP-4-amino-4,6-dideoxygalactose transaminase